MIVRGDFPYTASYVSLFEPMYTGDLTEVVSNFSNRLDTLVTAYTTPAGKDVPGMPNLRGAGYVTAVKSTLETKLRQLYEEYKNYVQARKVGASVKETGGFDSCVTPYGDAYMIQLQSMFPGRLLHFIS